MRKMTIVAAILAFIGAATAWAATVDGINLHYTSSGSGSQTVIFVHGWTCDETSWQGQVPAIGQKYRVITVDLPGHGKSGSPKDGRFSMQLFARAVEAVRSEAKAEKVVLCGPQYGNTGYPAICADLSAASRRPRARRWPVQVAGATPGFTPPPMTGPAGLIAREIFVRGMFGPSTTPQLQQHILKMTMGTSEATADGAMAATWGIRLRGRTTSFQCPCSAFMPTSPDSRTEMA